jgi:hypothetical protein
MSQRLCFGIFLAPFHKPGINPTLALQSDLDLIQWLDRCGYDEAWLGEHHSRLDKGRFSRAHARGPLVLIRAPDASSAAPTAPCSDP